ncbi:nicotinate-nucleotide--dimethylbenzimidazole phosphoribosyltransferase [Granulicella sibirica]|uniref:Nicotinate-nucleotide--dimethylbenzimidazole phosphoribosyltransferase n=1 Tax=Granulicella sibirica TaxID=2479048 RepID=A0A4Q0T027_9BACT|nr:nicotinate-nucleotide--dimethylbenzimidazole phosphoribosyltransferase [Granulicella sibirica]RXH56915.1 Nicotinate-nucleotide--dimethylbenzimidazole phosphoribosyltransferase [Granulicella sibirica]
MIHAVAANLRTDIAPPSEPWRVKARAHLDTLTKPLGSLGRLEDIAAQFIAIRQARFADPVSKAVYVFAADHGVTAEKVSAYPSEVTRQMVLNFLAGGAAINVLSRLHNVALQVIDVGVDGDFDPATPLVHAKVRRGSRNMHAEPAMAHDELLEALTVGIRMAEEAAASGHNLVAPGEMGIGNTTAASAITAALTGRPVPEVTGLGTGIDIPAREHKIRIIEESLALHFKGREAASPLEILGHVGGLEIAAITGFILAAARTHLAVVCDGFIATAAAAIAVSIAPAAAGYLIAGHQSREPGHAILLAHLNLQPILQLDMRLGEGTGAVLAMPVIESAIALYRDMATFTSAGVSEAAQ